MLGAQTSSHGSNRGFFVSPAPLAMAARSRGKSSVKHYFLKCEYLLFTMKQP